MPNSARFRPLPGFPHSSVRCCGAQRLPIASQMAHAHQLDEAQLHAPSQAVVEHREDLFVVVATQRHHVALHTQACGERLVDARQHLSQLTATGDTAECKSIQRIETLMRLIPAASSTRSLRDSS